MCPPDRLIIQEVVPECNLKCRTSVKLTVAVSLKIPAGNVQKTLPIFSLVWDLCMECMIPGKIAKNRDFTFVFGFRIMSKEK